MNKTGIAWTTYTENPLRFRRNDSRQRVNWACVKVSEGCAHCFSETINMNPYYNGSRLAFTAPNMKLLTPYLDGKALAKMLLLKGPARVFVCDMTDLFGEFVPYALLYRVFAIMAMNPAVTFQVLTKRSGRMLAYMSDPETPHQIHAEMMQIAKTRSWNIPAFPAWPLPNIWAGVSTENQEWAEKRIYDLLRTPAAVRWISAEPLLSSLDLTYLQAPQTDGTPMYYNALEETPALGLAKLDQIIVGGESGSKARPFDLEWAFALLAQCRQAGTPYFMKQLGSNPVRQGRKYKASRKGTDMNEWPASLRVQEFPG